ncbi:hypothetical protein MASR2M79_04210 [Aminivibrio sp.]
MLEPLVVVGIGRNGVGDPDDDFIGSKGASGGEKEQADNEKGKLFLHEYSSLKWSDPDGIFPAYLKG